MCVTEASRAEWALDSVVIALNTSLSRGFHETFDPMLNDVWYMAMNAVPRITCGSDDTALEFSKYAEGNGRCLYVHVYEIFM